MECMLKSFALYLPHMINLNISSDGTGVCHMPPDTTYQDGHITPVAFLPNMQNPPRVASGLGQGNQYGESSELGPHGPGR